MVFQAAVFPISECSEENLLMTIPLLRSPEWNDGDEIVTAENGEGDGIQAPQMQHLTNEMALLKILFDGQYHNPPFRCTFTSYQRQKSTSLLFLEAKIHPSIQSVEMAMIEVTDVICNTDPMQFLQHNQNLRSFIQGGGNLFLHSSSHELANGLNILKWIQKFVNSCSLCQHFCADFSLENSMHDI